MFIISTIAATSSIAVGDSENDICLVRESGIGIAFNSGNKFLNMVANKIITEKSFRPILDIAL